MMVRARVGEFVESNRFQMFIVGVIVVNAVTLGAETSTVLHAKFGPVLTTIDHLALAIFAAELSARLYASGWKFFKGPWNVFDFVIVVVALIPTAGPLSVLRSFRILRALRLVAMVPSMRRVVTALVRSIPGLLSLSGLLVLLVYVGGVIASNLFGDTGDPRFAGLGPTLLTLFQITTGDGWSDVMRDLMEQKPYAWIFFLIYLMLGSFTMLNLFIAVVCSAMQEEVMLPAPRSAAHDDLLLLEVRALRDEVRALRQNA
ncbi:voltage-gated sodium channel [Lentzea albidocapillata subsp. violacea]|uniref:Voltage-gated sodium channel n=1 Tax=Lentzea albidocapillata subsp. violacea TaxID=128104 RepID=A0A1G8UL04_9PSEU|nr:ion transporter [Lentzea albidocapillata]SDJ54314.1 voltage-gated sodium channel [Lentzea albidocapillata subsp. violacea]